MAAPKGRHSSFLSIPVVHGDCDNQHSGRQPNPTPPCGFTGTCGAGDGAGNVLAGSCLRWAEWLTFVNFW